MTLVWTPGWNGLTEPEAFSYVAAVEAADGQPLEFATAKAINDFILGCKVDGIWTAIKASCILSGARTFAGALVPLAGTAPTNFNFVSGDYNRKTGLVGNGTTKYLRTNRSNNADPQNSQHLAVYVSTLGTNIALGTDTSIGLAGSSQIGFNVVRSRNVTGLGVQMQVGFNGISRNNSANYQQRVSASTATLTQTSETPINDNMALFKTSTFYGTHQIAFYSIGESLNLALLDTRVTALINAFAAAIP
jgi:hypothetical protein